MSRLALAFRCFFRILFGGKLPPEARTYLPEAAPVSRAALPAGKPTDAKPEARPAAAAAQPAKDARPDGKDQDDLRERAAPERRSREDQDDLRERAALERRSREDQDDLRERAALERPKASAAQHHRDGALAFLALLQREGRLVDFLREPLDGFSDADIGAAARDVHRGCRKVLDVHLSFEPVMPGAEEDKVSVPRGFDPAEIRLIGEAKGEPPFRGTLRHHGWRVVDAKLPALADGVDRMVVAPAEVEL
jgi:Domain of unknown function (DUF2760)